MKTAFFRILLCAVIGLTGTVRATDVTYAATNFFGGLALTNALTIERSDATGVTLYGGSFILGPAMTPTLTNSSSAFKLFPGDYRLSWFGLPYSATVSVMDTNVTMNLAALVNTGAGTYTYTNPANFTVFGSPGDAVAGTLTEKIQVSGGLTLSTNTVGTGKLAVIGLPSSNTLFGAFSGNGSNLVNLRATNIQANSGTLDNSLLSAFVTTNLNWALSLRNTNSVPAGATNSFALGGYNNLINNGGSAGVMILGGYTNQVIGASYDTAIVGGRGNRFDNGAESVIAGGSGNWISGGQSSVILGGNSNLLYGSVNFILGGESNIVGNTSVPQNAHHNGILGGTNNTVNGSVAFNLIGGVNAVAANNGCFIWSGPFGTTNFSSTADNQFLIRAIGGAGINTNNPGTNALRVGGYVDIANGGLTLNGTNILTLFPIAATSNGIVSIINTTSNALLSTINLASNTVAVAAANAQTSANMASNSVTVASNYLFSAIGPRKAFSATLAATFTSQGQGFSAPLMPDGNFSVSLTPQDAVTAHNEQTNKAYADTKSTSGFTIRIPVQNPNDLHYDVLILENTQ